MTASKHTINHKLEDMFNISMARRWSFVSYKMPGESEVCGIIQREPCDIVKYSSDAEKENGFIIAPFDLRGPQKTYWLKPEIQFAVLDNQIILEGADLAFLLEPVKNLENYNKWHTVAALTSKPLGADEYIALVSRAKDKIEKTNLKKVVVSRQIEHNLHSHFNPVSTFNKLCTQYPEMFCCLLSTPGTGTWIGASPELLLQIESDNFSTVALAGTRGSSLFKKRWGQKEMEEQAWVSSYLSETMLSSGMMNIESHGPFTTQAGNLQHLKTTFSAQLPKSASISELMEAFHPTPAVCGTPKNNAKDFILKNEDHSRSYYSGFWGVLNKSSKSNLFVNLRCMQILNNKAILYVGGGITDSSIPENEWKETELKAQTLLTILNA